MNKKYTLKGLSKFEKLLFFLNFIALFWNVIVFGSYAILLQAGRIEFNFLAVLAQIIKIIIFGGMTWFIIYKNTDDFNDEKRKK